jgi:hypothetical protein
LLILSIPIVHIPEVYAVTIECVRLDIECIECVECVDCVDCVVQYIIGVIYTSLPPPRRWPRPTPILS